MINRTNILILFAGLMIPVMIRSQKLQYQFIEGRAQGTTYHMTYSNSVGRNLQYQVDSILKAFDKVMSTYDSSSVISRINKNDPEVTVNEQFKYLFRVAREVSRNSGGAFDVTVGPLVNAWGFGPNAKKDLTRSR